MALSADAVVVDPNGETTIETAMLVTDDTNIETVTVFVDRAEIVRCAAYTPEAPGLHNITLRGLTNKANKDSIRVKGKPGTPGVMCTILEVSCEVSHKPLEVTDESAETAAQEAVKVARRAKQVLDQDLERLEKQDALLQNYVGAMLAPSRTNNGPGPGSTVVGPPVGSNLDAVSNLLDFHAQRTAQADARKLELRDQINEAKRQVDAAVKELKQITNKSSSELLGAGGVKANKVVTISLMVPPAAVAVGAAVELILTYHCSDASWSPTYDARADLGESQAGAKPALNLTYFGVVKQSTGEDWNAVNLHLSTASPNSGGAPPAPPTRKARFQSPSYIPQPSYEPRPTRRHTSNMLMHRARMAPQMQMDMPLRRELSNDALEIDMESESDEEERAAEERRAVPATAAVKTAGAGAANFIIQRTATIASDNKEHKVTIAMLELVPTLRHFCTPELEEHAYLQCNSFNTSSYPLLCSDRVAIFFDGSFVATSHLKETNPGDKLTIFLGVDPTVKVEQKLIKESANAGDGGGLFRNSTRSRLLFEHRTLLHNTKLERPVDITVVQLLPRSTDDKITVDLLAPAPREVVTTGEPGAAGGAATGEGQLRPGGVMKNKLTNNIVFSRTIAPQEKIELPFSYSVSWPPDSDRKVEVV